MRRASVSMEQVRDTISNKQKLVIAINVLVSCFIFAVVITSISAASDAGSSRAAGAAGFVGVWNMLMILGVNVGTFWVLKKVRPRRRPAPVPPSHAAPPRSDPPWSSSPT